MRIRPERPADRTQIASLIGAAFAGARHSSGAEAAIVDALRAAGALALSLVAAEGERVLGHVAFSAVTIDGRDCVWFGLGPVAVLPGEQGRGIGAALIEAGLALLREQGAGGCVVLGDPEYYARFGFRPDARLHLAGVPPEYFQSLVLVGDTPHGSVAYHPAFAAG